MEQNNINENQNKKVNSNMSFNENNTQNVSENINKNSNQNYDQNQVNNSTTNSQNVNYQSNYNMNNAQNLNTGNYNNNSNFNPQKNNLNNTNSNFNPNNNFKNNGFNNNFNNASTYQSVKQPKVKNKNSSNFGKTILIPFVSGILGTVLVIGACIGIPGIRNGISKQIVGLSNNNTNTSTSAPTLNTEHISLENYSDTAIAAANKVLPSIVGIKIEFAVNSIFNHGTSVASAEGSGIIISEDGYILTNNHVVNSTSTSSFYEVEEASKVTVKLYNDNTEYEAKIIGTDEQTDLAVIKINKTGLTAAELGDSDGVQVGEFAMAIGNPLGLSSSVTSGIISAVNREITDEDGNTYVAIQTDASINSGNSGGALVNSQGQVIGVNTLKLSGTGVEGVGFAIPINSTKDITDQLIKYSKVKRPYIGIGGIELDEKTAKVNNLVVGIYVKQLDNFSAAEKGGVKVGDVITEVEGQKVTTMDEVNEIKNKKNIGDTLKLKIYRNGKYIDLTITLQEQP